jgi:DNA polymerase
MARALRSFKSYSLGSCLKELFGADTKGGTVHKVKGMDAAAIKRAGLWGEFQTYALNDVLSCARIYAKLAPEFPQEERQIMDLVLRAAVTPTLQANVPLLESHLEDLRAHKERLLFECGYGKAALMSTTQFATALEELGVEIPQKLSPAGNMIPPFAKTDPFMQDLLEYAGSPDDAVNYQVQTLAAARLCHKSTIEETRAERFVNIASLPWELGGGKSSLLPVPLRYGGAHTHRLSGEWSMNMQNLPRDKEKSRLRQALMAPEGYQIVTADLAQIEARIVAVLCGQNDLVEAFARNEDVYAKFASVVFHRTITKADNPVERFLGKTSVLGLGYGCGYERFYAMVVTQAAQAGIPLSGFDKNKAAEIVQTYRYLYQNISGSWGKLDFLLDAYINNLNDRQKRPWGPVTFSSGRIELPNRMFLRYKHNDPHLYGARILENITQALARIVVMQAALRLADKGLRFVLQAHDELVFVVMDAFVPDAKVIIHEEMVRKPVWLPGLPLAVEIGCGRNYGEAK